MKRKSFTLGVFIFFHALLLQALPVFGNSKLISLTGLPQEENTEKTEQLIIEKLQNQGLNKKTIAPCEITVTSNPNGFKISTILKNKTTERVHSYLPQYSMENLAEIAAQDLAFLSQASEPVTEIEPELNDYFEMKYFKQIFPELPGDFIPSAIDFSGNHLIISHARGTLELSSRFQLNDQSMEDIYNWSQLNMGQSTQPRKFADFLITLKADNSGFKKIWFRPDKQEEILLPLTNLDYIFSNQSWELTLIEKKQMIHLNVYDHSHESYPFAPGFITAAAMTHANLWVYNSLDKRLHLYNGQGKWIKSKRPRIRTLQSPFALIILQNKGFVLCDYGHIYGLNPQGELEWTIKNYLRNGIIYSLPAFFTPALSADNSELYILDYQSEQLMHYQLGYNSSLSQVDSKTDKLETAISDLAEKEELLLAFQMHFANKAKITSHQHQLLEKKLRIALKKRMCQGLLSRAADWEAKLNFQQAAGLLTYYTSEIKALQRLDPLNMKIPEQYQRALEKRNQLLQRINRLTLQKPDTKELALNWKLNTGERISLSLELRDKELSLPVIVTLRVPGSDSSLSEKLENRAQLQAFLSFPLTNEIKHQAPITISLAWPEKSKEFLWSESVNTIDFQSNRN